MHLVGLEETLREIDCYVEHPIESVSVSLQIVTTTFEVFGYLLRHVSNYLAIDITKIPQSTVTRVALVLHLGIYFLLSNHEIRHTFDADYQVHL